ncbi:MAG: prenyltransferase/squalene oxidase repeat-containing protein [Planctomycetota bacterium]
MRPVLLLCLVVLPASAVPKPDTAGRDAAIKKGIAHLEAHVFKLPEASGTPRKPFTTAVAGLCFLMEKRTGSKDRLRKVSAYLERYVERVAEQVTDPANLPPRHGLASSSYVVQYTWPLAAAGLYFAELEAHGRKRHSKTLRKIMSLLAEAQQKNGGWGHGKIHAGNKDPFPNMKGSYPDTLVSASNVVGITVGILNAMGYGGDPVVDNARDYYRKARLDNGSFPYDPSQRSSGFAKTNVGRTAGSIYAWHCLGLERSDAFKGSVDYLMDEFEWIPEGHGTPCLNMMHGALACRMLGKKAWAKYRDAFFPRIIAAQGEDGCLACICEQKAFGVTCDSKRRMFGAGQDAYTTALHTFVLLLDRAELESGKKRKPGAAITKRSR